MSDVGASEFPRRYAEALEAESGAHLGLTDEEITVILRLARVVAHGSERRFAPLAAFVAGKFVLDRTRGGVTLAEAVEHAARVAEGILGAQGEPKPE